MFFLLLVAAMIYGYAATPIPVDASQAALQQASVVYFRDGHTVVGTFGTTDRQMLTANQIPAVVKNAVVAAEDKHFYSEGGVSPIGIIRAAIADVTSGSVAQGGSTITQEFVRNYYTNIGTAQTVSRKVKEIFVAEKLAQEKSKDWILTQYLNTIPMGGEVYGFGAASEAYFGIPASKLDVAQAAMLAAKIQLPNGYSTIPGTPGYSGLVYRWHYVLNSMVDMGTLSAKEASGPEVPRDRGGLGGHQLDWLPRLHHAGRGERAGEHVPLHPAGDQQRRPAYHHHVRPAHDERAVRIGGAERGADGSGRRRQGAAQLRARRRGA